MVTTNPLSAAQTARFEELSKRSYRKVFNLAYRLAGNRSDAEELTQEAFFRAYRGFSTFEGDKPFENWIFRIVTRLFLDLSRARRRRVSAVSYDAPLRTNSGDETLQYDTPDPGDDPEEILMGNTVDEALEWSLRNLTEDQRRLIWLADVEGASYKEIAETMGAPVGTVRSRLHRTHKQLRALLEEFATQRSPILAA